MKQIKRWWLALALVATTSLMGCASNQTNVGGKVAGGLAYGAVWTGLALLDDGDEDETCCCAHRHARGRCHGRSK